jgi:multiple sugar transport system substrate-binding protein
MRQLSRLAWISLMALTVLLAACGGSSKTPQSTQQTEPPATLKIWDYSPEQDAFHQQVAAEYHKLHPEITIQWTSTAQAQYNQQLPLAFQSNQAPDIFFYKGSIPELSMSYLLSQNWISPLAPNGTSVPQSFLNRWPKGSFAEGINIHKGVVYGFPFTDTVIWGPGYMFYNKSIFQAAGISKAPTTWNELYNDCAAIKSKTGKYCLTVPLKGTDFQRLWYPIAGSIMTDQFFDYKNGTFDLNNPLLLQAFSYIQSLFNAGFVAPGVNDKTFSRQQMAAGQAAIYFDGTWMPSTFTQLGFTEDMYNVAPPPYPDNGPHGALAILNTENKYWVSSQTKYRLQAWNFILWMTDPTGFFAQGYLNGAFGTLAYANNQKLITDPALKTIEHIATGGLRVYYPEPLLQCPDLSHSQALTKASSIQPNQEWNIMVDAIVNNKDLKPAADSLVNDRQQVLTSTLQQEAASGLKVSLSCYSFTSWSYNQNFNPANYHPQN